MQKISDSTSTANAAGEFTEGNPAAGAAATLIKAPWLNAVQRELENLIVGAGLALNPVDDGQVLKAIKVFQSWAYLTGKPTTLGGYGIKDAYTAARVDEIVGRKADKADTLSGYGIADAYTKTQSDGALQLKANVAYVDQQLLLKAGKATTLAGYGINNAYTATEMDTALGFKANLQSPTFTGIPRADTAAAGSNNKQLATTEYADRLAADPWAMQPIGVPIPVMAGAGEPPTNKAYRYVKLTQGDPYNTGVLSGEVVTGVAPMVTSYARVSLAGSPIFGNTVYLLNTERRSIRPGAAGSLQDDALQNITGAINGSMPTASVGGATPVGAIDFQPSNYQAGAGIAGTGILNLTFDASRVARTSNETRIRNIGANYYMRVL